MKKLLLFIAVVALIGCQEEEQVLSSKTILMPSLTDERVEMFEFIDGDRSNNNTTCIRQSDDVVRIYENGYSNSYYDIVYIDDVELGSKDIQNVEIHDGHSVIDAVCTSYNTGKLNIKIEFTNFEGSIVLYEYE